MGLSKRIAVAAVLATGAVSGAVAFTNFRKYRDVWGPESFPGEQPEVVEPVVRPETLPVREPPGHAPAPVPLHHTFPSPHVLAAQHAESLALMRLNSPPAVACGHRFTDAELMRYAVASGWLAAPPGSVQAHKALLAGASAAWETCRWLKSHRWATEEERTRVAHLAHWLPDVEGRPCLELRIGRASREEKGKHAAQAFGNVVVTLVEEAVREGRLADVPGDGVAQDLIVRVDASGATIVSAARIVPVVRHVAVAMNHHYPGRLYRMELHHLPPYAVWLVSAVRKLMHATTRDKVVVIKHEGEADVDIS